MTTVDPVASRAAPIEHDATVVPDEGDGDDGVVARTVGRGHDLFARLDRWQQRHRRIAFVVAVVKKFGDDRAGNLAALVAYFLFFSLFPLMLVFTTLIGFVLAGRPDLQQQV